jgi:hypothetical protein
VDQGGDLLGLFGGYIDVVHLFGVGSGLSQNFLCSLRMDNRITIKTYISAA